jgi:hypothetical protein
MTRSTIRVGCGAGFSDDRIDPAQEMAEKGKVDYLAFECLAERTIARENLTRLKDPEKGYTPYLAERFQAVLPACIGNGIRIVTNMGAANPLGAAKAVRREAKALGLPEVPVAVVLGDDVTEAIRANPQLPLMETGEPVESLLPRMAAANAYLGADVVRDALATGAPVVMTGRVADPSLFLACMLHGLGWGYDDYPKLAVGTIAGHMMECAAQLTGGCFADPGRKDVPGMASIGFPYADIGADGSLELSKVDGLGRTARRDDLQGAGALRDARPHELRHAGLRAGHHRRRLRAGGHGSGSRQRREGAAADTDVQGRRRLPRRVDRRRRSGLRGAERAGARELSEQVVRERLRNARLHVSRNPRRLYRYVEPARHGRRRAEPYEVRLRIAARSPDRKAAAGGRLRDAHPARQRSRGRRRGNERLARGAGREIAAAAARDGETSRRGGGPAVSTKVYELAHARAGDKGNTSNVSVVAYDDRAWRILRDQLTVERVMAAYSHVAKGPVTRYELPKLKAFNFVIENALGGGVTISLAQDAHGKSLSYLMLDIELAG